MRKKDEKNIVEHTQRMGYFGVYTGFVELELISQLKDSSLY